MAAELGDQVSCPLRSCVARDSETITRIPRNTTYCQRKPVERAPGHQHDGADHHRTDVEQCDPRELAQTSPRSQEYVRREPGSVRSAPSHAAGGKLAVAARGERALTSFDITACMHEARPP